MHGIKCRFFEEPLVVGAGPLLLTGVLSLLQRPLDQAKVGGELAPGHPIARGGTRG